MPASGATALAECPGHAGRYGAGVPQGRSELGPFVAGRVPDGLTAELLRFVLARRGWWIERSFHYLIWLFR